MFQWFAHLNNKKQCLSTDIYSILNSKPDHNSDSGLHITRETKINMELASNSVQLFSSPFIVAVIFVSL